MTKKTELAGKIAVITGAGSGIGRATARLLAARGAKVHLADLNADTAEAVARQIRQAGGTAEAHAVDVADPAAVEALAKAVYDADGRVDILHNNAGIAHAGNVEATTTQVNVQQDARRIAFAGDGQFSAYSSTGQDYAGYVGTHAALVFDLVVDTPPAAPVHVRVDCGYPCGGSVDVTKAVAALPLHAKATLEIPLRCFADQGVDFAAITVPFAVDTSGPFVASFANIRWQVGADKDPDALPCAPGKKSG